MVGFDEKKLTRIEEKMTKTKLVMGNDTFFTTNQLYGKVQLFHVKADMFKFVNFQL